MNSSSARMLEAALSIHVQPPRQLRCPVLRVCSTPSIPKQVQTVSLAKGADDTLRDCHDIGTTRRYELVYTAGVCEGLPDVCHRLSATNLIVCYTGFEAAHFWTNSVRTGRLGPGCRRSAAWSVEGLALQNREKRNGQKKQLGWVQGETRRAYKSGWGFRCGALGSTPTRSTFSANRRQRSVYSNRRWS